MGGSVGVPMWVNRDCSTLNNMHHEIASQLNKDSDALRTTQMFEMHFHISFCI